MLTFNVLGITILGILTIALLWLIWKPRFNRQPRLSKKRMAIRNYSRRLSRSLRKRYGLQDYYTPQQVRQSIQAGSYSTAYDCYALAMYCNQEDFTTFHQSIGESCNYEKMRNEINNSLTFHNQTFNATDMIDFGTNADNHSSYDHHLSSSLDYGNHSSHSIDSSNGYDCSSGYDGGGGNCG
jgi:hypothetical protein